MMNEVYRSTNYSVLTKKPSELGFDLTSEADNKYYIVNNITEICDSIEDNLPEALATAAQLSILLSPVCQSRNTDIMLEAMGLSKQDLQKDLAAVLTLAGQ